MTRRMAILVAVVGLMVMAFAGTALAVAKVGNAGPNRLVGTAENDTLKGRSGADTIIGKGDSDRLYGGRGADTSKPANVAAQKTIRSTAGGAAIQC
jgi:hypothetical protein